MKITVAIDSFKGSMTSIEAGEAAREGILRVYKDAEVEIKPIADGGEGTVDALVLGLGGKYKTVKVKNPLGATIEAKYGIVGETAIMEMAAASGIALIKREELNPMITTTYGVGEMIKDAILNGCRSFVIGIGGSATNDGGTGMLSALGFEFFKADGTKIANGACELDKIEKIVDTNVIKELKECTFNIACDVTNPLCGEFGASRIFGPQKGASDSDVLIMDKSLEHFGRLTMEKYADADMNYKGAGAAGGLGFAFLSYLGGKLKSGISLILDEIGLEDSIKGSDLVITGEGRIDAQTVMGKAPAGVAGLAKKHNKPVVAFAGGVTKDARVCNSHGIDALFPIVRGITTLESAMDNKNARENMSDTVEQVMRLYKLNDR